MRTVTITRHAEFGFELHVAGLPPIWCCTRAVAVELFARTLWHFE